MGGLSELPSGLEFCLIHHPSGNPNPSSEDKDFTKQLIDAGEIMQIKVLDHIVIGDNCYFSFVDEGLIEI